MRVNQNSLPELGIYPEIIPTPLSSNSAKTAQLYQIYQHSQPCYESQRKYETVQAKLRVRSTTKIRSKNSLYPYRYFIEQLVGAFGKSPQESNLNHESSSLLIR
jgi:hypothetical protein